MNQIPILLCALLLLIGVSLKAFAEPAAAANSSPAVIQGVVTSVEGNTITLKTPNLLPNYPPGAMHPSFIIAGKSYKIDVSQCTYENVDGSPMLHQDLKAGDSIVVVVNRPAGGNLKDANNGGTTYSAVAVERIVGQPK